MNKQKQPIARSVTGNESMIKIIILLLLYPILLFSNINNNDKDLIENYFIKKDISIKRNNYKLNINLCDSNLIKKYFPKYTFYEIKYKNEVAVIAGPPFKRENIFIKDNKINIISTNNLNVLFNEINFKFKNDINILSKLLSDILNQYLIDNNFKPKIYYNKGHDIKIMNSDKYKSIIFSLYNNEGIDRYEIKLFNNNSIEIKLLSKSFYQAYD